MYNRYIPQPDGSYRRSRVSEPQRPKPPSPPQEQAPCQEQPPVLPPPKPHAPRPSPREHQDAASFLKRLLPQDFDTGDLLIIVLLLLMAGDCAEDRNTALLTLVLYLFL